MSRIRFVGWDKKPRTMLRFIKPGDVLCFLRGTDTYCFGRIMTKASMGHFGEIFEYASEAPSITEEEVQSANRMLGSFCLDSFTLFDTKIMGDWRIIGHQKDYRPEGVEGIYFAYGLADSCKRIDILGNTVGITEAEAQHYEPYMSCTDARIQKFLDKLDFPGERPVVRVNP